MLSQQLSAEEKQLFSWLPDQEKWQSNQIVEGLFCSFFHTEKKLLIVVEDDAHDHPDAYTYREILQKELAAKGYKLLFLSSWEIGHSSDIVRKKLGEFSPVINTK
jgi:very-short-patch-repair endonuclease